MPTTSPRSPRKRMRPTVRHTRFLVGENRRLSGEVNRHAAVIETIRQVAETDALDQRFTQEKVNRLTGLLFLAVRHLHQDLPLHRQISLELNLPLVPPPPSRVLAVLPKEA